MKKLTVLLALVLSVITSLADGLPTPQVTVNTQTVAQIVAVWDKQDVPAGVFAKLAGLLKFNGVYNIRPDKGNSSGGMAALASLATIQWDAMQFDIGPAYVVGMDNQDGIFQAIEAGVATKFIGGKIQERLAAAFDGVPVLDLLPKFIDVSGFTMFAGVGATLGGVREWEPTGFIASIGGGGIKFGK